MWFNSIFPFFPGFIDNPAVHNNITKNSYTIRIEEWLKEKHPDLDPIDAEQLLQAGKDTVFKNMPLNTLDEKYRDTFIIQFLNRYYMREIGQETTDFFRQNLNSIIVNHGRYISSLYDMSEKKYFIEYSYRTVDGRDMRDTNSTGARNTSNSNNTSTDNTASGNTSQDTKRDASQDNTVDRTGEEQRMSSGSDERRTDNNSKSTMTGKHSSSSTTDSNLSLIHI